MIQGMRTDFGAYEASRIHANPRGVSLHAGNDRLLRKGGCSYMSAGILQSVYYITKMAD